MNILLNHRWGWGLGTAAAAAAAVMMVVLATPKAQATAISIMAKGAQAVSQITSIHLRGQLRTLPADNFSYINPDLDFETVELWKQFEPEPKWRVEKPGRVALMNGESTILYIKSSRRAVKIPVQAPSAFDTDWLHQIANLSNTISNELKHAQSRGWKLGLQEKTGADGRSKAVVTVHAKSGVPDTDYLKNSFFENADTRRVYWFDAQSERLEAVQVFLLRNQGEVRIFELSHIEYDRPIEPGVWNLDLPADVHWQQEPQPIPDNAKYASMTPEEAARAFFEACSRKDWDEAAKFMSLTEGTKDYLGGIELVSLGQAFGSATYPGRFVPYEIKVRGIELNVRLSNENPAKRYVITGTYDKNMKLLQEATWAQEPEVLPDNPAYASLSPAQAAKAAFAATAKLDWVEMSKFVPPDQVRKGKAAAAEAEKRGQQPQGPVVETGEAFWSEQYSAWFVKCQMQPSLKKHNLALRKDNQAGRWQVDGGI